VADFAVLSEDPTAVAADRIAGLEVVGTVIDGRPQFG
jgi:predicted amidohydrolase YtcJ